MKWLFSLALGLICLIPQATRADQVNVSATVLPVHYLVVDADHQIHSVVTNDGDSADQIVYLGSTYGPTIPFSQDIKDRYQVLHVLLDFKFRGVIYGDLPIDTEMTWWDRLRRDLQG